MNRESWGYYLIGAGTGALAVHVAFSLSGQIPHAAPVIVLALGIWLLAARSTSEG